MLSTVFQPALHSSVSEARRSDIVSIAVRNCAHKPYLTANSDAVEIGKHTKNIVGCLLQQFISASRSFGVSTGISYISDLRSQRQKKKKVQWIEVRRICRLSNMYNASNPYPRICGTEVIANCNGKKMCWCTIVHKPHVLDQC